MENKTSDKGILKGFTCFVGLDLSLTATGVSVLHMNEFVKDYTTTLSSPNKGTQRLNDIAEQLGMVISNEIWPYEDCKKVLVCIENYAFSRFGKIAHLGELGGVIKYNLLLQGFNNVICYPPTTLKKFATGKGVAEKGLVMTNVYKRWNVDASNNNEADAYVLSRLGHCLCYPKNYTEFQKEAASKFQLT